MMAQCDFSGPVRAVHLPPQVNKMHDANNVIAVEKETETLVPDAADSTMDVESVEMLIPHNRNISDQDLKEISDYIIKKKMKKLELVDRKFSRDTIAKTLVTLIDQHLETIVLSESEISGDDLQYISENMSKKSNLKNLDLSHIALDKAGVKAVAKILTKASKMMCINLHNCKLDGKLLKIMLEENEEVTNYLKELILSSNPKIRDSIEIIASIADKFGCEEIDISTNYLDGSHFQSLAIKNAPQKLSALCVCENPIDEWQFLGELVNKWDIKALDVSMCVMFTEDSCKFAKACGHLQLKTLRLYHPDRCEPLEKELSKALKDTSNNVTFKQAYYSVYE